jgi:hypothetical protein
MTVSIYFPLCSSFVERKRTAEYFILTEQRKVDERIIFCSLVVVTWERNALTGKAKMVGKELNVNIDIYLIVAMLFQKTQGNNQSIIE